jgi:hypothetical protein
MHIEAASTQLIEAASTQLIEILQTYPTGELDFLAGEESLEILFIQGNLAIPIAMIPNLLSKAYDSLFKYRVDDDQCYWSSTQDSSLEEKCEMNSCTLLISCFHPECYSIWNYRKFLTKSSYLNPQKEFELTSFLLTKHASKGRIWEYRSWLLDQFLLCEKSNAKESLERWMLSDNDAVCLKSADKYKCNYPSWGFRRKYFLNHLESLSPFLEELDKTKRFIKRHVGDYSGWAYRQSLCQRLAAIIKNDHEQAKNLFCSEIDWIREFILFYPNHESCWLHYRFMVDLCLSSCCVGFNFDVNQITDEAAFFCLDFEIKSRDGDKLTTSGLRHATGWICYLVKTGKLRSDWNGLQVETLPFWKERY